jgi:hypothetical protein
LAHWPGLSRSEALKIELERGHYLSTLNSEEIASLADEYRPILREALRDLNYDEYRLAARELPALVAGFLKEEPSCSWHYEQGDNHALSEKTLVEKLNALSPLGRIGVLDCIVAERYRRAAGASKDKVK